jgi:hypothetical protein
MQNGKCSACAGPQFNWGVRIKGEEKESNKKKKKNLPSNADYAIIASEKTSKLTTKQK